MLLNFCVVFQLFLSRSKVLVAQSPRWFFSGSFAALWWIFVLIAVAALLWFSAVFGVSSALL